MRGWTGLAAAVVFLGLGVSEARGDCAIPRPWVQPEGQVLPEEPTLYIFGADANSHVSARCVSEDRPLVLRHKELPTTHSGDLRQRVALKVGVHTQDCTQMVVFTGDPAHPEELGRYALDSSKAPAPSDAPPGLRSATRRFVQYGCGPEDRLLLYTNLRAPAFSVEVRSENDPTTATLVVPTFVREEGTGFFLGRTMCRGSNIELDQLDQPMEIRLTALYSDGSSTRGIWQTVAPPTDYFGPGEGTEFLVSPPPPTQPDKPAEVRRPEPKPAPAVPWEWIVGGFLGGLVALAGLSRLRKSPTRPSPP